MDDQRPRQQGLVHVRGNPFTVPGQRNPILQTQPSQERLSRKEEERRRVNEKEKVPAYPFPKNQQKYQSQCFFQSIIS